MKQEDIDPNLSSIIFDDTVLSNLTLTQILYVIRRLYAARAFIGKATRREIQAGIRSNCNFTRLRNQTKLQTVDQAIQEGWMQITDDEINSSNQVVELRLCIEYSKLFSTAESEAMAIAHNRNWVFASDDGTAKRFARKQGIRVTGTLGILAKAVKSNVICSSVANRIYAQLIEEGNNLKLPCQNGISSFPNP